MSNWLVQYEEENTCSSKLKFKKFETKEAAEEFAKNFSEAEIIEIYPDPICKNCAHWYKNDKKEHGKNCYWTNKEVPKEDDYCSRFNDGWC